MSAPNADNDQDFYCDPPKEIEILDLKQYGENFMELCLDGCMKVKIVDNYLPEYTEYLNIEKSCIKFLDMTNFFKLEQLHVSDCPDLKFKDDYIPIEVKYIKANGNARKDWNLAPVIGLYQFFANGNYGLRIKDGAFPPDFDVLCCEGVDFDYTLDFSTCPKIFSVVFKSGKFILPNEIPQLFELEIQDYNIKLKGGDEVLRYREIYSNKELDNAVQEVEAANSRISELKRQIGEIAY